MENKLTKEQVRANVCRQHSKGHRGYFGRFEYYTDEGGDLYRAPRDNPMDIYGYRMGARWECYPRDVERCLEQARRIFAD